MERNTIQEMRQILDAIEQGKKVQFRRVDRSDEWVDYALDTPDFFTHRYRIKPEEPKKKLLTNRELAKWLAQGNGEASKDAWRDEITYLNYLKENENEPVYEDLRIRKWDDEKWHKPTKEYCFGEEDA